MLYLTMGRLVGVLLLLNSLHAQAEQSALIDVASFVAAQKSQRPGFCRLLTEEFAKYRPVARYGRQNLLALELVDVIRKGILLEYLPISTFLPLAAKSSLSFRDSYLPVARIVGGALGVREGKSVMLIYSESDLRFVPQVQNGTELIVVTGTSDQLNPQRSMNVVNSAKSADLRVSVLWYGRDIVDEASLASVAGLLYTTSQTGGKFVSVAGSANPCGRRG